ncbi:MAG TPA: hypothetical protein DCM05_15590 [Elusimicrobia bacterium]|nr:hypothetical protein [Elusimicrobiota bacterium]
MSHKAVTWLILAAVLVVPAVLFYNWLGKMKAQTTPTTAELPRKADAAVSTAAAAATPFTPSQASTAAAAPQDPPPQLASMGGATAPADPAAAQPANPEAPAPPAQSPPAAADIQAQPGQGGQAAQPTHAPLRAGEKPIEYAPATSRDPTISPIDVKRKLQEAEQKRLIDEEKQRQYEEIRAPKTVRKERPAEPPIEERIHLYGVVSTPSGRAAIVNDGTAYEGDTVMGAVIKRITTNTVFFQYRGRTFSKKVTK